MSSAVFALVVNSFMAALFAAAFIVLSRCKEAPASTRWFAGAYLVGMLTPLSELGVRLTSYHAVFSFSSFATFVSAFLLTAVALARHFDRPAPWKTAAAIFAIAIMVRILIWNGTRNTMPHELIYQTPFAVATLLCWWIIHRSDDRSRNRQAMSFAFLIVSLHFIFKAQAAVIIGSGDTAQAYAASPYALLSQSVTAILLVATGLLLLHSVFRRMLDGARSASQIDALSGLLNRRGFEFFAKPIVERVSPASTLALVIFDLDHFKRINDGHGHAVGDEVIRRFAGILRSNGSADSICARIGGEEFAVLIENCNDAMAQLFAEGIRAQFDAPRRDLIKTQTSAGVTSSKGPTSLESLLVEADIALYRAKRSGRNCVRTYHDREDTLQMSAAEAG